ncbi:MAG: ester cyclase [Candidatus Binatia bacterium]
MSGTVISAAQLEVLWNQHLDGEFQSKDVEATLATMVEDASVLHVPVNTGGRGRAALRAFYRDDFIFCMPADFAVATTNRIVGVGQLVDEVRVTFTHTCAMPWMLPDLAPTGRRVEVIMVVVVQFEGAKLAHERIYWDHAGVLRQLGRL